MKNSILVVEDDSSISKLIKMSLNIANYFVETVEDGEKAIEIIKNGNFDLILLDVMLPNMDGFTIMKKIRNFNIPVIFLTAKNSTIDKVTGLKLGADDYMVKPFEPIELIARIETVLRRFEKVEDKVINFKHLNIYLDKRIVKKDGKEIELTPKEFELLKVLIVNKNIALSRNQILDKVWGMDYLGETRTIDMHIKTLRKKLELHDNIKTVYKFGYRLEE
ncbi:response regulator transcription factor [Clostridium oceanicum]|uniref:Stage 0 sporulation protein A homolog n=1 Tax=Clostridium oceanicum TaxID=1543 RepID=A0ABP3UQI2_9CLOT